MAQIKGDRQFREEFVSEKHLTQRLDGTMHLFISATSYGTNKEKNCTKEKDCFLIYVLGFNKENVYD